MGASQQALIFGSTAVGDPYWSNVVLLVDASNYANGTTPAGVDVIGKTPTYNGNCAITTSQAKFGTSSLAFDGTGDLLSFADSADWAMGTGDATWEAWFRTSVGGATQCWISQVASAGAFYSIQSYKHLSGVLYAYLSDGATPYGSADAGPSTGVWTWIAVVRHGGNMYTYVSAGGTANRGLASSSLSGVTLLDSSGPMCFGAEHTSTAAFPLTGNLDQIRITKGVARYTAATVDVPTAAFPHF